MTEISVALVGNPNVGKSTIFNALTGSNQHIGNWPGKTVEKKNGRFHHPPFTFSLLDLPGTYSLSAFSPEEIISREAIIDKESDMVLIVVDAANLERNLYLTVQVLEMQKPAILILNMSDMAQERGIRVDVPTLSQRLGIPVITAVARKEKGIEELRHLMAKVASKEQIHVAA